MSLTNKPNLLPLTASCEKCEIYIGVTTNLLTAIKCLEKEKKILKTKIKNNLPATTTRSDTTQFKMIAIVKRRNGRKVKTNNCRQLVKNIKFKTKLPFLNVTIMGDSHARHLASIMREITNGRTNITGICKPGAGLLGVVPTSNPPPGHCFVLLAGTNDVAAGRQDTIYEHLERIIARCSSSSSVMIVPLPPRHDLPPNSPVHESVALVNNYISELCSRHEGVELLNLSDINRHHFTAHGLHLKASGKRLLAYLITRKLGSCF